MGALRRALPLPFDLHPGPDGPMHPCMFTVLYFAAVRELAGVDEETIQEPIGTVGQLRARLERLHPSLCGRLGRVRFARNEQFAPDDTGIADGDVIALIPPVAGG
jgi:sulfur-carrier protein